MLLRLQIHRPAIVLLASSMVILLIAGTAAAHDVVSEPGPTQVVTVGAAAASVRADEPATAGTDVGGAEGAAAVPSAPPPSTVVAAAPADVAPPPSTRPGASSVTPTSTAAAPTSVPLPPTSVVPPPPSSAPPPPSSPPPPLETVEIGPGAWRSIFGGITATLHMTPVAPQVGQVVQFSIDTTYTGDGCCMVFLYPGDGTMFPPEDNSMDCSRAPSSMHRDLSHTYTHAGSFEVHVQPSVLPCRIPPEGIPAPVNSHLYATISIAPAA